MTNGLTYILIAHDHQAVRRALEWSVAHLYPAAHITTVLNGREALASYVKHGADLVITQGEMPGMGGIDLIRALRARQATCPMVMIAFDHTLEALSKAAGASDFLAAPFGVEDLRHSLKRLLPRS